MVEYKKGDRVKLTSGREVEVLEELGRGGQGIVYRVNYGGKPMALKWYFPAAMQNPTRFYDNLQQNVKKGPPTKSFLWPQEVTIKTNDSFGYLMDLFPKDYKSFSKFLVGTVHFSSISAAVNACLCISNSFRDLHRRGYSYQDMNDGNFCINPVNGDVLICDNDNVAEYGDNLGIMGKARYMAPEVSRGVKRPDVHTDRFSLAVMLYMMLFFNHPLEGAKTTVPCLTEKHELRFYGTEPVFTYDPVITTNRPVKGVHTNTIRLWPVFPEFVRQAFRNAFSQEKLIGADTEHRTGELDWQNLFTDLRDVLIRCPKCGCETFVDLNNKNCVCRKCGSSTAPRMVIKSKRYTIPVIDGHPMYACHSEKDTDEFRTVTGMVNHAPNNPSILGLKNMTKRTWHCRNSEGTVLDTDPGRTVKLTPGLRIDFGNDVTAEVK